MNNSRAAPAQALERACNALWSATLSLMVAYMQTAAPAHRLLLARRIAVNFQLLAQQEAYSESNRDAFARLARRWNVTAQRLGQPRKPEGRDGLLAALLPLRRQHL